MIWILPFHAEIIWMGAGMDHNNMMLIGILLHTPPTHPTAVRVVVKFRETREEDSRCDGR